VKGVVKAMRARENCKSLAMSTLLETGTVPYQIKQDLCELSIAAVVGVVRWREEYRDLIGKRLVPKFRDKNYLLLMAHDLNSIPEARDDPFLLSLVRSEDTARRRACELTLMEEELSS
jgi:hypothetical protein